MTEAYPKKYWWLVLVALPIALALFAILPDLIPKGGGGGSGGSEGNQISISGSTVQGDVQIIGSQVIYQQLAEVAAEGEAGDESREQLERAYNLLEAGFYKEAIPVFEQLAQQLRSAEAYNNLGALYMATGQESQAMDALREGLAVSPKSEALRLNLAQLYEQQGKIDEAMAQLASLPSNEQSKQRLEQIREQYASGAREQEPNNDIITPNLLPLGETVFAHLDTDADIDYFQFASPAPPRDILSVELNNLGTSLGPQVQLWSSNKQHLWSSGNYPTPGQNLQHRFSADSDTTYYVSVHSRAGSGKYQLSVKPLQAFDAFEPNDTILSASNVSRGSSTNAVLMDENDEDFYRLDSTATPLKVELRTLSAELGPQVKLWDTNKRHLWSSDNYPTPGQDLQTEYNNSDALPAYISINSRSGSGAYQLEIE